MYKIQTGPLHFIAINVLSNNRMAGYAITNGNIVYLVCGSYIWRWTFKLAPIKSRFDCIEMVGGNPVSEKTLAKVFVEKGDIGVSYNHEKRC